MQNWKPLLLAVLGVVSPFLYSILFSDTPDFPLTVDNWTDLLVWIVGLLVGGWTGAKAYLKPTENTFFFKKAA